MRKKIVERSKIREYSKFGAMCLPLLMETCQCIENALTRASTYTIILGMCIYVCAMTMSSEMQRVKSLCHCTRRSSSARRASKTIQWKMRIKTTHTHTYEQKPLLHIAVYHAEICIFILAQRFIYLRAWHRSLSLCLSISCSSLSQSC